jgi:ubiquinone/menaquinone biosynthesis C-methylase UbiE
MSRQIIQGTAEYVHLPEGSIGLDVGCGSGALTIACAKRNPQARMIGMDRWGKEYASFSKKLCESNAEAEGVENVSFQNGDAVKLAFPDESFDAVTSNYVYHNIPSRDRKILVRETLRVLKKGGCFAIHGIMSASKYGDMEEFVQALRQEGFERVELIDTTNGKFMSPGEAKWMGLAGSALLVGIK